MLAGSFNFCRAAVLSCRQGNCTSFQAGLIPDPEPHLAAAGPSRLDASVSSQSDASAAGIRHHLSEDAAKDALSDSGACSAVPVQQQLRAAPASEPAAASSDGNLASCNQHLAEKSSTVSNSASQPCSPRSHASCDASGDQQCSGGQSSRCSSSDSGSAAAHGTASADCSLAEPASSSGQQPSLQGTQDAQKKLKRHVHLCSSLHVLLCQD